MAVIRSANKVFEEMSSSCLVFVGGDKPHTIMNRVELVLLPGHLLPLLSCFRSFITSGFRSLPTSSLQAVVSWMKLKYLRWFLGRRPLRRIREHRVYLVEAISGRLDHCCSLSGGFGFSVVPENTDSFVVVAHLKWSKSNMLETDSIERNRSEGNKTNL